MSLEVQNLLVALIVGAAVIYVIAQAIQPFFESSPSSCGTSCGNCPTDSSLGQPKPFVSSDQLSSFPPKPTDAT